MPNVSAYLCIAAFTVLSGCNNDFSVLTKKDLQYLPIAKCAVFEPTLSCAIPAEDSSVCGHQPLIFTDSNPRETLWQVSLDNENWIEARSGSTTFGDIPDFATEPCEAVFTFYMKGEELCNSIEVSVRKLGVTLSVTSPLALEDVCGHNTISFTDSDSFESIHEVSVDGTNWHPVTSGVTRFRDIPEFISGVGCGAAFTLYIRGQDACNHTAVSLVKKDITLAITSPDLGDPVCGHNTVTFTDSDSLETAHQATIDEITWVPFTSNSTMLSAVPGFSDVACGDPFTLHLRGGDGCNVADISLVKKGATLSITSPSPAAEVCGNTLISFSDSDGFETAWQASINGSDWVSATSGVTTYSAITGYDAMSPGTDFTLYIRGADSCNHVDVDITTATPTVSITSPAPGATLFGDETISFTDSVTTTHQASIDQISWSSNLTSGSSVVDDIPGFDGIEAGLPFSIYLKGANSECNLVSVSVVKAAFTDSRTITLDTTVGTGAGVSGNVSYFPVLIRLRSTVPDEAGIIDAVRPGAPDIRFYYEAGGEWLDYQIERWDKANHLAEVWVLFPLVHGSSDTDQFTMHFGNATIADGQDPDSVFSTTNGFVGVWHMGEDPSTSQVRDSTGNGLHGTPNFMVTGDRVPGQVGNGLNFDGSNNYISLGTSTLLQPSTITVSCWVKRVSDWAGYSWVLIYAKNGDWRSTGWQYQMWDNDPDNNSASLVLDGDGSVGPFYSVSEDFSTFYVLNQWVYVAFTFYPGTDTGKIFKNGVQQTVYYYPTGNNTISTSGTEKKIGEAYGAYWPGQMDELNISNAARSADWIKLCYENQKDPQSLVTINP